jgi:ferrous iron transport protein B
MERMLPLTFQLIEAEIPLILDLNMIDEAERLGLRINVESLEKDLGIPIVTTVATTGQGIPELKKRLKEYINK